MSCFGIKKNVNIVMVCSTFYCVNPYKRMQTEMLQCQLQTIEILLIIKQYYSEQYMKAIGDGDSQP